MRVLTVCVGISAYRRAVLEPGERPLQFLADSARHLSECFAAMWPDDGSIHRLALDDLGSLANVKTIITAESGSYDVFVLYLGGHGRGGNTPFEFLFYADQSVDAVARSRDIDTIVALPQARNVLLLLDACHSGEYGEETTFFRSRIATETRLCIASCLLDQKSWEDPLFRQSLFADAVAKALSADGTAPKGSSRAIKEVFNEIATNVARHAFALKGGSAQEPTLIGDTAAFFLPVVLPQTKVTPSITTYKALLRRSRQIVLTSVFLATILAGFILLSSWRPAINDSGYIELRPGPKWLSILNVGPWQYRVETEMRTTDLSDDLAGSKPIAQVLDEAGVHPWPGINGARVRRWADVFIDQYLNSEVGMRWRVRLGYEDAVERLTRTVSPGGGGGLRAPRLEPGRAVAFEAATEEAAEAKILNPSSQISDAWRIQWQSNVVSGHCDESHIPQDSIDRIDFYLNLSEPAKFARWLHGLAMTAMVDDTLGFEQVANLIEMFTIVNATWKREYAATIADPNEPITAARIAARFTERPTNAEVAALAEIASAIVNRRLMISQQPLTALDQERLIGAMEGCTEFAVPILAALGSYGDPARVVAWAHLRFTSNGRPLLRELAMQGALPEREIGWVLDTLGFSGDRVARKRAFVDAREWLTKIADAMPLPPDVLERLVNYTSELLSAGDVQGARQAIAVILRSPRPLSQPFSDQVNALLKELMGSRGPLPVSQSDLELLGLLARSGATLAPEYRDELNNVMGDGTSTVNFTESDKVNSASVTELVAGNTSVHLLAFSRFLIGSEKAAMTTVDKRTLPFLQRALRDAIRYGVPLSRLREVFMAAAIARIKSPNREFDAIAIRDGIRRFPLDTAARRAEVETSKAALSILPKGRSGIVINDLRRYWHAEPEPETKLALAEVIIATLVK